MNEKLVHDLRGPLARAKTALKLLQEDSQSEYLAVLESALAELEKQISRLVEKED